MSDPRSNNMGYTNLVVDLFSGTGSATAPFQECGKHTVLTVDSEIHPGRVPLIRADVRSLPDFIRGPVEFLWASPPCVEFSQATNLRRRWGYPGPDPQKGMELVLATKRIIDRLRPAHYAIENVKGSVPWISQVFGRPKLGWSGRWIWANFAFDGLMPAKLEPKMPHKKGAAFPHIAAFKEKRKQMAELKIRDGFEGYSAFVAMIPRPISEAVHKAVCGG